MMHFIEKITSFFRNLFKRNVYAHVRMFGVCEWKGVHYLVGAHKDTGLLMFIPKTGRGFSYGKRRQGLLVNKNKRPIHTQKDIDHAMFSSVDGTLYMLYTQKSDTQEKIHIAASKDGIHFKKRSIVHGDNPVGITKLETAAKKKELILFYGQDGLHAYRSINSGNSWNHYDTNMYTPTHAENHPVTPLALSTYNNHLYLLYKMDGRILDALIDNPNISHIIWDSSGSLWKHDSSRHIILGVTFEKSHITIYTTNTKRGHVEEIVLPYPLMRDIAEHVPQIEKHSGNPVISPHDAKKWEALGTFNPAAIIDEDEHVHILYRAVGTDGVSRLGYAYSGDGYTFENHELHPAYAHGVHDVDGTKKYDPILYPSGGSWGGCEDPRLTKIGGKVFMTYTAFSGWGSIRIALTSIAIDDFIHKRWDKWSSPILISPPGETHKNWVIFPEKINGKYAILHGIAPRILIEYVDDIEHIEDFIQSERPQGPQKGREGHWDNLVRGAGPPPLKTKDGWLLFYHALDRKEFHKYKVGAMLLDLNAPEKVLYRSHKPVISPEMNYENEGKPGIVYASGALIKNGTLFIYYGGGDRVSCVASAPLETFIQTLKEGSSFAHILRTTKIEG